MLDDKMPTNESELPEQARQEQENRKEQESQYEDLVLQDHPVSTGRRPLFGS